jgi:hypothetical protein
MEEAELFLVRVWREASSFRASVRSVLEERAHLFTAPEELTAFFAAPPASQPPPSDSS